MTTPDPTSPAGRRCYRGWIGLTVAGLAAGLLAAPLTCNRFDVVRCALPWAAATGGLRPWAVYRDRDHLSIYPPVIAYVLTAVRRVELWTGLPVDGVAGVVAVKVPCLLAFGAGAWVCAAGLAPVWGRRAAGAAATAYALCLPIWYDAAVWGQWDSILCLALLAAGVAAVRDRPGWAGAAAGAALAVKVQAVVLLPPLAVYGLRRWGGRGVRRGVAGMAAGWGVLVAPMLAGGPAGWEGVRRPFADSAGLFHFRTVLACNVWMVSETATPAARVWPVSFGHPDDGPFLGPVTSQQVGLALFAVDAAVVLACLWHRPTPRRFALATGLLAFGFFMLLTQMHERYGVAACAPLALVAGRPRGARYYLAVTIPAAANLMVALPYLNATTENPRVTMGLIAAYQPGFLAISVANVAVLVLTLGWYVRETVGPTDGAGPAAV